MSDLSSVPKSGYLSGYEEDLFLSYGHVDNTAPTQGWIAHLHEQLEGRLKQLLGVTDLRIWRDRKLNGLDDYEEVLKGRVSRSALFLSVLSPRYVTSPSCAKEVNWFLEAARKNGRVRVDSKSRMIRVIKTPLQGAPEPAGLREVDTLGFRFYAEMDDDFREFPANPNHPGYAGFEEQLERLAKAVNHLLRKMKEEKPPAAAATGKTGRPRTVFLAETTKDLKPFRDGIRNELSERGHRVLPEENLTADDRDEIEAALAGIVPACDFSIHLLGRTHGKIPEGEETRSVARLQYEWIREHRHDGPFQQLVWIPEDLAEPDPRQAEFLRTVVEMKGLPGESKVEIFKTGLASFKEGLLDILNKEARAAAPPQAKAKSIYLICNRRDLADPAFQEIRAFLLNQGYPIDVPAFEGDPGDIREAEMMSIADSDVTVIYYGLGQDSWVKLKRKALLTALSEAGKRNTRALYLGGPESDLKKGVYVLPGGELPEAGGSAPLLVLGDCGPFRTDHLRPLLKRLEAEG